MAALLTAVLALGMLSYRAATIVLRPSVSYAPAFKGETKGPAAMLNTHDGQAFASLALDPLLSRPSEWTSGRPAMAYRATRPLLGWLVMLTSAGSARLAQWSLLVWTAIGAGMLAGGAYTLGRMWGRRSEWVPFVLLLPGMLGQLIFGGLSDGLAAGLALFGMAWWLERRDAQAIAALCLAALCRETTLLVPLALMVGTEFRRGRRLLLPFCAYAAWVGVVWLRLQAFPTDPDYGRLSLPLTGFLSGIEGWGLIELICAASVIAFTAIAFWRAPCREIRWLVGLSVLFASTLGARVWESWDFTRPLLPVTVVGACLLARRSAELVTRPVGVRQAELAETWSSRARSLKGSEA